MIDPREEGSLLARVRRLPREAWLVYVGTFINRFGAFVIVFLVLYITDLGYSEAQAGLVVSAYGLGGLGAATIGGWLADRIGRRNTIAASMFGSAACLLVLVRLEDILAITAATAVVGMLSELYRPAATALLTDIVPEHSRVAAFSAYRLAINAGFAAGPAVGGFLAERSWDLVFYGDALTAALYGVIALAFLPHGVTSSRRTEARGEGTRAVLADRRLLWYLAGAVLGAYVYIQAFTTVSLHVTQDAGFSTSTYGMLMAVNGTLIILFELPLVAWTERRPAVPVLAVSLVISGFGFLLTGYSTTLAMLVVAVGVWTFAEMLGAPVAQAYLAHISPAHLRGRYAGTVSAAYAAAGIIGPALGTALFGWRAEVLWWSCAVAGLAAAACMLAAGRADTGRITADAPTAPGGAVDEGER